MGGHEARPYNDLQSDLGSDATQFNRVRAYKLSRGSQILRSYLEGAQYPSLARRFASRLRTCTLIFRHLPSCVSLEE